MNQNQILDLSHLKNNSQLCNGYEKGGDKAIGLANRLMGFDEVFGTK